MRCDTTSFSAHALKRMFERALDHEAVIATIKYGELIANYPEDTPFPSSLLLYFQNKLPVHVLVARNLESYACYIVTVYVPDPKIWNADFKTRRL